MTLVDVPLVHPDTVRAVVNAWRRSRAPIVRPARGDEHGHPVIFDCAVFDELRSADRTIGAKAVVRAHAARSSTYRSTTPARTVTSIRRTTTSNCCETA